jgi:cbb3-type cytochrome oxidase maturation protein
MSVVMLMLPIALLLAGLFVWAFIRSVKSGQYDDLDTPPIRAVLDDDPVDHTRGNREIPAGQNSEV